MVWVNLPMQMYNTISSTMSGISPGMTFCRNAGFPYLLVNSFIADGWRLSFKNKLAVKFFFKPLFGTIEAIRIPVSNILFHELFVTDYSEYEFMAVQPLIKLVSLINKFTFPKVISY